MHILIGIAIVAALIWLFSANGNFKRNARIAVAWCVGLSLAVLLFGGIGIAIASEFGSGAFVIYCAALFGSIVSVWPRKKKQAQIEAEELAAAQLEGAIRHQIFVNEYNRLMEAKGEPGIEQKIEPKYDPDFVYWEPTPAPGSVPAKAVEEKATIDYEPGWFDLKK